MIQIERDLIRVQILFEVYEKLFCICNYEDIITVDDNMSPSFLPVKFAMVSMYLAKIQMAV